MKTITFYGTVDEENTEKLLDDVREAMLAEQAVPEEHRLVRLIIVTEGGTLGLALHAYDMLRFYQQELGVELHTIASGYCFSAGTILLQAGVHRLAMPNAIFMVHQPWQENWNDGESVEFTELEERIHLHRLNLESLATLFAVRTSTDINLWRTRFEHPGRHFLTAYEALKFQMVDEVVLDPDYEAWCGLAAAS